MPRTTLLSISAGTAVLVGRDVPGTPIGGLSPPGLAMPCPCALLAKIARLAMSNHGVLTPIYYGKFLPPPATAGLVRPRASFTNLGRRSCRSRRTYGFFLRATM